SCSLWDALSAAGHLLDRTLCAGDTSLTLGDLALGSSLGGRLEELRDRSVLVTTADQLPAALALIELDGIARRLVLCPPDLPAEHVGAVMATTGADAVVSDRLIPDPSVPGAEIFVTCRPKIAPVGCARNG